MAGTNNELEISIVIDPSKAQAQMVAAIGTITRTADDIFEKSQARKATMSSAANKAIAQSDILAQKEKLLQMVTNSDNYSKQEISNQKAKISAMMSLDREYTRAYKSELAIRTQDAKTAAAQLQAANASSPQARVAGLLESHNAGLRIAKDNLAQLEAQGIRSGVVFDKAATAVKLFETGNARGRGEVQKLAASLASLTFEVTGAIYGFTALVALIGGPALFGIASLKRIEDAQTGIAGILLSMATLNGEALTFGQAWQVSGQYVKEIQKDSLKYGIELGRLTEVNQAAISGGLTAHLNLTQIRQVATAGAIAVSSLGLSSQQYVQEVRDLISGGIQPASSTLARSIGVTDAILKQWTNEGPDVLVKMLTERLQGFIVVAEEVRTKTLTGAWDVLQSRLGLLLSDKEGFGAIKSAVIDLANYLGTVDVDGTLKLNPEVSKAVEAYWSVIKAIGSAFQVVFTIVGALAPIFVALDRLISKLITPITIIAGLWVGLFLADAAISQVTKLGEALLSLRGIIVGNTVVKVADTAATLAQADAHVVAYTAQLTGIEKVGRAAKGAVGLLGAGGVIGAVVLGAYVLADHLGWIDSISNKLGDFFNTQESRIRKLKNLAGAGAAGGFINDAIAEQASRQKSREAAVTSSSALDALGLNSSGKDSLEQQVAAADRLLSIDKEKLGVLQKQKEVEDAGSKYRFSTVDSRIRDERAAQLAIEVETLEIYKEKIQSQVDLNEVTGKLKPALEELKAAYDKINPTSKKEAAIAEANKLLTNVGNEVGGKLTSGKITRAEADKLLTEATKYYDFLIKKANELEKVEKDNYKSKLGQLNAEITARQDSFDKYGVNLTRVEVEWAKINEKDVWKNLTPQQKALETANYELAQISAQTKDITEANLESEKIISNINLLQKDTAEQKQFENSLYTISNNLFGVENANAEIALALRKEAVALEKELLDIVNNPKFRGDDQKAARDKALIAAANASENRSTLLPSELELAKFQANVAKISSALFTGVLTPGTDILTNIVNNFGKALSAAINTSLSSAVTSIVNGKDISGTDLVTLGIGIASNLLSSSASVAEIASVTASEVQKLQGTGTVLGSLTEQSMSISNSLTSLQENTLVTSKYSASMAKSLKSIEASTAGFIAIAAITLGGDIAKNLNVPRASTGRYADGKSEFDLTLQTTVDQGFRAGLDIITFGLAEFFGGPKLAGKITDFLLGSSKSKVSDTGLIIQGTIEALRAGNGISQYVSGITTTQSLGGLRSNDTTFTNTSNVTGGLAEAIGSIYSNIADSLTTLAVSFGQDGSGVTDTINKFQTSIGKLSLEGLSAEGKIKALNAAISKDADLLAAELFPSFVHFQLAGEGLFQTVVRVAQEVDNLNYFFKSLGREANITAERADALTQKLGGIASATSKYRAFLDGFAPLDVTLANATSALQALGFTNLETLTTTEQWWAFQQMATDDQLVAILNNIPAIQAYISATTMQTQATSQATAASAAAADALAGLIKSFTDGFAPLDVVVSNTTDALKQLGFTNLDLLTTTQSWWDLLQSSNEDQRNAILNNQPAIQAYIAAIDKQTQATSDAAAASATAADALASLVKSFTDGFAPLDVVVSNTTNALKQLGFTNLDLLTTTQSWWDLLQSSNEDQRSAILNNQPAIQAYIAAVDKQKTALESSAAAIKAETDAKVASAQTAYDASKSASDSLKAVAVSIRELIASLGRSTVSSLLESFDVINTLAASGDTSAQGKLSNAATGYIAAATAGARTQSDVDRATAYVKNALEATASGIEATVSSADATLSATLASNTFLKSITTNTAATANNIATLVTSLGLLSTTVIAVPPVPSFAVGSNYIPTDMMAQLHQGEQVTPRVYVDKERGERAETNNLLEALREELRAIGIPLVQNTKITAKLLKQFDSDGLPETRLVSA
jgi:hypothetical protein